MGIEDMYCKVISSKGIVEEESEECICFSDEEDD